MSGQSIQRTLNKAFGVVGRVLGWEFTMYRPDSWITPLADRNSIGSTRLSGTPDDAYSKDPDELDKFKLYTGAPLALGDILHSEELERTYVVFDKTELRAVVGVLAQDRIDVLRPTLTIGDQPRGFDEIASSVPAAVKITGASSSAGALKVTSSTMSASSTEIEVWTWVPSGLIQLNDVLEIGGNRYLITFAQTTYKGTKLKARSTKVGK